MSEDSHYHRAPGVPPVKLEHYPKHSPANADSVLPPTPSHGAGGVTYDELIEAVSVVPADEQDAG